MDKLKKIQIVRDLVEEIGNMVPSDEFSETQAVLDLEGGHFVLFDIGWQDTKRVYLPFVHIDVKEDGKIWVQHDGTDLNIAGLLTEKGIPQNEIVIGYKAPHVRQRMEGFAVA